MQSTVVLINAFSVPKGMEDEFLEKWNQTAQQMQHQPGLIETKLHRSLDAEAEFQFVNVALWESPDAYRSAMTEVEIFEKALPIKAHPALYRIEAQY